MKATKGRFLLGRYAVRLTLSRSSRSPAGPTATEMRNEYSVGEDGSVELFEFRDPDPDDAVDVEDETDEPLETEPLDVVGDRALVLVPPVVADEVALVDDVVVSFALLGSDMKCLRNGS